MLTRAKTWKVASFISCGYNDQAILSKVLQFELFTVSIGLFSTATLREAEAPATYHQRLHKGLYLANNYNLT